MSQIRRLLIRIVALFAGSCLAAEGPLEDISVMAWLGGWEHLREPHVSAPAATGETSGDLEDCFHVDWRRDDQTLHVKITKLADAWVGRVAVECHLADTTTVLTYGDADVPVPIPVREATTGEVLWSWEYGLPSWLVAESAAGRSGVVLTTAGHHGFFINRHPDGSFNVHINLDWPKAIGASIEASFRLAPGSTPAALQTERRGRLGIGEDPPLDQIKLDRLRAQGFVRVDDAGLGFVTDDGTPLRILGQNTPHLAMLSPAEQERILSQSEAAGITVTRFLISDYAYRPLGAWNPEAFRRLLATIDRCASHGIRSVICLEYSGCGGQYNESKHRSPNWSDLYLMPEMLAFYEGTIERVVKPLRDNPAVLSYNVTNEPDLALSPSTPTQSALWRAWLLRRYGTIERLREAWQAPDLESFDVAGNPEKGDYDWQRTQQARDFMAFGGEVIGGSMINRARLVRAVDSRHLLTVSAWAPRLLRGLPGADIFDYWAPHSYEIYFIGPEISEQVMFQLGLLRRALPDRPRPVVIEEFGLHEDPKFPESMRAEHCLNGLEAGHRWGVGMMLWYDLTPALLESFTTASQLKPVAPNDGPPLAFYVAPNEECRSLIYPMYMWRRKWGRALAAASEAGFQVREVSGPADAAGSPALLVLGDALTAAAAATIRDIGLPVVVTAGADAASKQFPDALVLPDDAAGQTAMWREHFAEP